MSYLALARKWRPKTFAQLLGQEHVNKSLISALNQQRLHHAYLFTGTRGVGKTSIARILAKALNCEQGTTAEPCLNCDTCIAIDKGCFIDLIEIDAASKTRVEDIRELLDNVPYAPTQSRFKIYLIDEVHMLSTHSFNALLKTLEEPPGHVKFILATTDPQKIPVTVLSRCLQFHLKHLAPEIIQQQLQQILNNESYAFELDALKILADAAQGSMRDALTLLDQAITSSDNHLKETDVKALLGYTQQDFALQLLLALADNNPTLLLNLTSQINSDGGHFHYVLNQLLTYLHHIAVYQSIGDTNPLISPANEIKSLADKFSAEDVQLFYQISLRASEELHLAPSLAIGFSMNLLRMHTFRPALPTKIPTLAFQNDTKPPQETPKIVELSKQIDTPKEETSFNVSLSNETTRTDEQPSSSDWSDLIPKLNLSGLALNALENSEFISKEQGEITLAVARGHQSLFTPAVKTKIQTALSHYYSVPITLSLNAETSTQSSPAQQKSKAMDQKQKNAEDALLNDPQLLKIKQEFAAEMVKNSIVPL